MFKDLTSARIVADSINNYGDRLTTMIVTFPRHILAEFNTHRAFSRNSASSRAIPSFKMIKSVEKNPYVPIKWIKKHKGMQGTEYFSEKEIKELKLVEIWKSNVDYAICKAKEMSKIGLSKQIINRILEPYMWHTVIVTFTEIENFINLRANSQAESNIEKLAYLMLNAMNSSNPKLKKQGEWHIPFEDELDTNKLLHLQTSDTINDLKVKIAIAKCARVSYTTFDGSKKENYAADLKLHDALMSAGHMSPSEHVAMAMSDEEYVIYIRGKMNKDGFFENHSCGWHGNFKGFIQARKMYKNENRKDDRVSAKYVS